MEQAEFRRHFPIFEDGVHLCSCSEGALSDRVQAAMAAFMESWQVHAAPWDYWMTEVVRARGLFAALIHADPADVAWVSCASEAAFQAASTQLFLPDRNRIIANDLEFPSIAHVWLAQEPRGAEVRFIRHRDGIVRVQEYLAAIDERVQLVSIPLAAYANGLRLPVREIADAAHRAGARVVVDAYQGAGVLPIDVRTLGADYLFAGTLKYLLGAPGIAFLWVNPKLPQDVPPALTGWFGRSNPFAFTPETLDWAPAAGRYQTGTPAIPAAFAAVGGLSLLAECSPDDVAAHVAALAGLLQAELAEQGWDFYSPTHPEQRGPQVTIRTDKPAALSQFLTERRIFASPRGQAVRLSLHYYNNTDDVARTAEALRLFRAL
jgi:selenocysteine lyase/cysteine desulfurase